MYILGALFILDWITGLIAAFIEGTLSSKEGLKRIPRKIGMVIVICLGHFADVALGTQTFWRDACLYFYLANEILSIIENLRRAGVPIPPPIQNALKLLREKAETPGKEDDTGV